MSLHGQIDFVQDIPKKRPSMQEEDAGVGAEVEEVAGEAPTGAGEDAAGGTPRKTGGRLSRSKNRKITEVEPSQVLGSRGDSLITDTFTRCQNQCICVS